MTATATNSGINVRNMQKLLDTLTADPKKHQQHVWGIIGADAKGLKDITEVIPRRVKSITPGGHQPSAHFFEVKCPTGACAAGWMCQIAGDTAVATDQGPWGVDRLLEDRLFSTPTEARNALTIWSVIPKGGGFNDIVAVGTRGAELLGLSPHQAEVLFDSENSRRAVVSMLRRTIAYKQAHPDQNILIGAKGRHHLRDAGDCQDRGCEEGTGE